MYVNIVVIEKWNIKTVEVKRRQIFFSGKAKQNKVGTKAGQVFFSGKAIQNKVGGKEWLGCLDSTPTWKQDNWVALFLQLNFVLLNRWRRFVFVLPQPFLCFTFRWQKYLLSFCCFSSINIFINVKNMPKFLNIWQFFNFSLITQKFFFTFKNNCVLL